MRFGDNLRKLRKSKNLSQEDLAEKMKVSRQSVSKWETGDAYPEMNNLLELCKIFHCNINDLVNDSILDINSLDEEIRMGVVKLKKEQQNKMKSLSNAISIIAKIGRVVCTFCIPIVILSMIVLGIVFSKMTIKNDEIIWNGNDIISVTDEGNKISLKVGKATLLDISGQDEIVKIKDFLQNNSKIMVFIYVEVGFTFLIINLGLIVMILKALESLFININKGDTPFTLENVSYIKKMAYLMIVITLLPNVAGFIFEALLKTDLDVTFEMFNLVEILFLFSISYIFQYGYEIQLDSNGIMYGDENE